MPQPVLLQETTRLRAVVCDPRYRIRYTNHALVEMAADDIVADDVRLVLQRGEVTWFETKKEMLWHVEGKDADDRKLRLVAVVYDDDAIVKLVTAMLLN